MLRDHFQTAQHHKERTVRKQHAFNHVLCKTSETGTDGLRAVRLTPCALLPSEQHCTQESLPAADHRCGNACKVQIWLLEMCSPSRTLDAGGRDVIGEILALARSQAISTRLPSITGVTLRIHILSPGTQRLGSKVFSCPMWPPAYSSSLTDHPFNS